jgi:RNA polymerase sporulation-specific sigma factor
MSELTARLFGSIRALAYSVNPQIADDLLQEGLLAMLLAINSYDERRGTVKTYVLACAKNRMLSSISRLSLQGGGVDSTEELEAVCESEYDFAKHERFARLCSAVENCLTEAERRVVGCYMTGRSYKETAQLLGITEKSVDNAMQRARKKLKREFEK